VERKVRHRLLYRLTRTVLRGGIRRAHQLGRQVRALDALPRSAQVRVASRAHCQLPCARNTITVQERNAAARVALRGGRVRSHCRFRNRDTNYFSESVIKRVSGSTKRQCDRALRGGWLRAVAVRAQGLPGRAQPRRAGDAAGDYDMEQYGYHT
jgi:hypothetical protein